MRRTLKAAGVVAALTAVAGAGCNEGDTITNNPPTLSATCSASPTSGTAPLDVAFALGVAGAEGAVTVTIGYGDGSTGSDPDVNHTYAEGGLFTASFDVRTPTQSARCAVTVQVAASAGGGGGTEDNLPPVADFRSSPGVAGGTISGTAPFTVKFNMCRTADPEGDTLYFTMDLNGDGSLNVRGSTGASCREPWTYAAGTWTPLICVTDLGSEGQRLHPFQCRTYTIVAS
jgi:PKD repeat protein